MTLPPVTTTTNITTHTSHSLVQRWTYTVIRSFSRGVSPSRTSFFVFLSLGLKTQPNHWTKRMVITRLTTRLMSGVRGPREHCVGQVLLFKKKTELICHPHSLPRGIFGFICSEVVGVGRTNLDPFSTKCVAVNWPLLRKMYTDEGTGCW